MNNLRLYSFSDARNSEISLALYRKSLKSTESHSDGSHFDEEDPHVFVILGASVSINESSALIYINYIFVGWFSKEENLSYIVVVVQR